MIQNPSRPSNFESRFRLYIDESGDHVFRATTEPSHRFLCLLGCWFSNPDYLVFHDALEDFKKKFVHHHPDRPVILHREDIINARRAFKILQDEHVKEEFDAALLSVIAAAKFSVVAVVIDKDALFKAFAESAAHPYHLGLGFLLQRYAGYLNHISRVGDVMAEARGGTEDRRLKESYAYIYERGAWQVFKAAEFQAALSSSQLKLSSKGANIAGLQLADILAHPVKQWVLKQYGVTKDPHAPFANQLMEIVIKKFNRHLYEERIEGYGYVLYPKIK